MVFASETSSLRGRCLTAVGLSFGAAPLLECDEEWPLEPPGAVDIVDGALSLEFAFRLGEAEGSRLTAILSLDDDDTRL